MERTFVSLLIAATLSGCAGTKPAKATIPWPECAKERALSWLQVGASSTWPAAASLPGGVEVQAVSLGAFPPEAIHDALYRTLHLVPSRNVIYVEQTGGIAGMRHLYGPVSLAGHCTGAS